MGPIQAASYWSTSSEFLPRRMPNGQWVTSTGIRIVCKQTSNIKHQSSRLVKILSIRVGKKNKEREKIKKNLRVRVKVKKFMKVSEKNEISELFIIMIKF